MRSGYESFLRRQLSKPRTSAPRWPDPPGAGLPRPGAAAPACDAPPTAPASALPAPSAQALDETMPAILWRAAPATGSPAPALERLSLAEAEADAGAAPALAAEDVVDAADSRIDGDAGASPDTQAGTAAGTPGPAADSRAAALPGATQAGAPPSPTAALDELLASALDEARAACTLGAAIRIGMARLDELADAFGEQAVGHVMRALRHRLRRLLAQVAPRATVCGVGEALWIVLPGLGRTSLAEALVRQLLEALTRPLNLRSHPVALHGSAGLAVFPHDGMDPAAVRRAAEVAWRQARQRGRSAYQFYAREIESRARRRLAQEARLRHAITHDALGLLFQPRAEIRTGALCGAQVVLAGQPEGQPAWSGAELLQLAQEFGLGEALAHWSLGAVCRQAQAWLSQGLGVPRLAVPVLPAALRRPGFGATAAAQARALGIDPARLTLMLSPPAGAAGLDPAPLAAPLRQCREAGFHLGMDGAATTGCSLAALRALPLTELHLDCALLQDGGGLGEAIVALGHALGLRVVAGGVADEARLDRLAQIGCDEFHGTLLAEPLAPPTWAEVMAGAQGRAGG